MDDAAAPRSTSIDSMSSVQVGEPVDRIVLRGPLPGSRRFASLSTARWASRHRVEHAIHHEYGVGRADPVLLPRIWICVPPPAPEFWLMIAPGTRPAGARRGRYGTRETSSPLTLASQSRLTGLEPRSPDPCHDGLEVNTSGSSVASAVF